VDRCVTKFHLRESVVYMRDGFLGSVGDFQYKVAALVSLTDGFACPNKNYCFLVALVQEMSAIRTPLSKLRDRKLTYNDSVAAVSKRSVERGACRFNCGSSGRV
jgi:hypothetical protein